MHHKLNSSWVKDITVKKTEIGTKNISKSVEGNKVVKD